MREFIEARELGLVVEDMDFRLNDNTVRNPDVALIEGAQANALDQDRRRSMGACTRSRGRFAV